MVCVYCLVFLFKPFFFLFFFFIFFLYRFYSSPFSSIYILPKGETVKAGFLRRESASEGEKDKSQYN
jgi:hypothetical protein